MNINRYLSLFFKFCLSLVVSIVVLSLFCIIYSYSGVHIFNNTGATDYTWQAFQYKGNMTEGFAWMNFDKYGFNNLNSSISDIDVLLMGSSHMEAVQIKQKNNLGEILNNETNYSVYNIGMSGHQIYNIVNNYQSAIDFYSPSKYVLIETDRVDLDYNLMLKVIDGNFDKIPSYDSGLVFYVQKIPAVKTIYKQIQDWISLDTNSIDEVTPIINEHDNYQQTLYNFLNIIASFSKNKKVVPIIFYHPSEKLLKNGDVYYDVNVEKLNIFKIVCDDLGIVFINMSTSFEKFYKSEYKLAHGFSNTHVGSGHLNNYGHRLIADKIKNTFVELDGDN